MRLLIPVLALCALSQQASAQSRVVPLPDTVGASFPIADSVKQMGTADDYDALLGVWHFTFQQRRPDGTYNPPFVGHWTFRKRPGTRPVVEDHWRRDDPNAEFESGTLTYRAFNPSRKVWEVQGTSTSGTGSFLPGIGWSDSTSRYLVQYLTATTIMRFRYFALESNHFLWRADLSTNGGLTWTADWWIMEATRVGR